MHTVIISKNDLSWQILKEIKKYVERKLFMLSNRAKNKQKRHQKVPLIKI